MGNWIYWAATLNVVLASILLYPIVVKVRRRNNESRTSGIQVLSDPEHPKFEIVAVHGLGAHPEYTWTREIPSERGDKDSVQRVHLLNDFLKPDFPEARILSFGHNSNWLIDAPIQTAQQIGDELLKGLSDARSNNRRIPIIFIGHSFGGIIIKEALCKPGDNSRDIVDDTCGIIFLGTPHQGSPVSVTGAIVTFLTKFLGSDATILLSLRNHHTQLTDLECRFRYCMKLKEDRRQKTEIVSFYEKKPTYLFGWLSLGVIVPATSAIGYAAKPIGIDSDHSSLNKCRKREDTLYVKLEEVLKSLRPTTKPTLNGNQQYVVEQLKDRIVEGAAFDEDVDLSADKHKGICYPKTRVDLLSQIDQWVDNPEGEHIYWLRGAAGTGKSTISRTVANNSMARGRLGASFFFKRGSGDRDKSARFFTTIAVQLVRHIAPMAQHVRNVIEVDPTIGAKGIAEQFDKLILEPLGKVKGNPPGPVGTVVVVVDALDECAGEDNVRLIIYLLSRAKSLTSVRLRFFVTSRLDLPVQLGFKEVSGNYTDLILHKIPEHVIKDDIATFLEARLQEIRNREELPMDWPDQTKVQELVTMAAPLFIFAATACRFIEERRYGGTIDGRLQQILTYQTKDMLDATYLPVLDQMLMGLKGAARCNAINEFKVLVGSIVTLASPLSSVSLASLLRIENESVKNRLELLHSVLDIPPDAAAPVRLYHLSFRDFLLDSNKCATNEFWVDEERTQKMLTSRCLQLLSESKRLRKDLCDLRLPGKLRKDVNKQTIDRCLPPEVQYACLYWVHHLKEGRAKIQDGDQAHQFLQRHFLNWLEALSLLGRISESINLINELQTMVDPVRGVEVSGFLRDAERFALSSRSVIDMAPMQLYSSALIFAPESSIIRKTFQDDCGWIMTKPIMERDWGSCLQTLEGHSGSVTSVAFLSHLKLTASGSRDKTIKIWDTATGSLQRTLHGHGSVVTSVAFSSDSKLIASGSMDKTIKIWDTATGSLQRTHSDHSDGVTSVAFSSDSKLTVSGSCDRTIKIWDTGTWSLQRTLGDHSEDVTSVAFSSDSMLIVSGSRDKTIKIWDTRTGSIQRTLSGHIDVVASVAFSSDSKLIVSGSYDRTIKIWDTETGSLQRTLYNDHGDVRSVAFSPDSELIISGAGSGGPYGENTIRIWNTRTGSLQRTLHGHGEIVTSVAFSSESKLIVSGSVDKTIKIWDTATRSVQQTLNGHGFEVRSIVFSANSKFIASGSFGHTIKIWDAVTGSLQRTLNGHGGAIRSVAFSPDSKFIASGSHDETVRIWDVAVGSLQRTLRGHGGLVLSVVFSHDSKLIASGSSDRTIKIWDTATGSLQRTLHGHGGMVTSVAFSSDSKLIVSGSMDKTIKIWDTAEGSHQRTLDCYCDWVWSVTFSPDSKLIASGLVSGAITRSKTVKIWDLATGSLQQTIRVGTLLYSISFDDTSSYVVTGLGSIKLCIRRESYTEDQAEPQTGGDTGADTLDQRQLNTQTELLSRPHGYGLSTDTSWITWNGNNALWLPPKCRPSVSATSPSTTSTMAFGCLSGRVLTISFLGIPAVR